MSVWIVCAGHCHKVVSSCRRRCCAVNPDKQNCTLTPSKEPSRQAATPSDWICLWSVCDLIPLPCHCLNPTPVLLLRFKISNPPYALNCAVLFFFFFLFHFFVVNPFSTARSARKGAGPQEGVLSAWRGQSNYLVFL